MAIKISALPAGIALAGTDRVPMVQGGVTRQAGPVPLPVASKFYQANATGDGWEYHTAAEHRTALGAQATLVSGTNIKTVNGESLLGSGNVPITPSVPAGAVMVFAMASAPTGWTQTTSDLADNRMLRVVNTAGGGSGGTHSPILNNVVPSHTHGFSTGTESTLHSHAGWTGGVNANHSHPQNVTANPGTGGTGIRQDYDGDSSGLSPFPQGVNTQTESNDHAHFMTTEAQGVLHTHSGSTDNGSSQTNWTPRYIDLILCTKN